LLRTQHAELVPLGIGKHGPRLSPGLPDVHPARTEGQDALDLGISIIGTRVEVEVQTVLDRLHVRYRHEADPHRCILISTDDDLSPALGQDAPVQYLSQDRGQGRKIMCIDDNVMQRHRHGPQVCQGTTLPAPTARVKAYSMSSTKPAKGEDAVPRTLL